MFNFDPFTRRIHASFLSGLLFAASVFPSAVILAREPNTVPDAEAQLAAVEAYFREMRSFRDTLPDEQYDPVALVRSIGTDPEVLLSWVRENTVQVPYAGRLRSPAAVMMDGTGNSLDRAVLLAHLLRLAGHEVKLASASMEGPRIEGPLRETWHPPLIEVPQGLMDPEALAFFSGVVSGHERRIEAMAGRLAVQVPALQAFAEAHGVTAKQVAPEEKLYWWVVLNEEEALDPSGQNDLQADEWFAPGELDEALYQSVTVEVRVERWEGGRFQEETALRHAFRPAEYTHPSFIVGFMADEVNVTFSMAEELGADFSNEVQSQMIRASNWVPYFELGSDQIAQKGFDKKGILNENHLQSAQGRAMTQATGLLGGLGIGGAARGPESVLTAVDLAFIQTFPDGGTREVTRRVYDLFSEDPDREHPRDTVPNLTEDQKLSRGLELSHHSEVLVQSGFMPRDYATASQLDTLLRNRSAILGSLHFQARGDMAGIQSSLEKMTSFPAQLYDWAAHRSELNPHLGSLFFAEAHLVAWHNRFKLDGQGTPILQRGYDILSNRVRSIDGDAEATRVQGVVDAVVESVLGEQQGLASTSTSALMEKTGADSWKTLQRAEEVSALGVSPEMEHALLSAVRKGMVLLVPDGLAELPESEAAWWELDPASGTVMARIAAEGWGGFGEYVINLYVAKAQIGLLAFGIWQCSEDVSLGCVLCNSVGAAIIIIGLLVSAPVAIAALAIGGAATNLGCGVYSAM